MENGILALARQKIQQAKKYFEPTEQVRVRDFYREIPNAALQVAKAIPRDMARFGISAMETPGTLRRGTATGKFYDTPLGRINSFQSEAQNRVRRGDPLWKAIGNPALDTILAGSDVGALARPMTRALASMSKVSAPMLNFANDPTMPGRFATSARNSYLNRQPGRITTESIPGRWVDSGVATLPDSGRAIPIPPLGPGRRYLGNPFRTRIDPVSQSQLYGMHTERYLPPQTVERGRLSPTLSDFGRELKATIPRPGMTVEDVTRAYGR